MKKSNRLTYAVSSVLLLLVCGVSAGILVKINFFPTDSVAKTTTRLVGSATSSESKSVVEMVDLDLNKRTLTNFKYYENSFGVKFVVKNGFGIRRIFDSTKPYEMIYSSEDPEEYATQVTVNSLKPFETNVMVLLSNNKVILRRQSVYNFFEDSGLDLNFSKLKFYNSKNQELDSKKFMPNLYNLSYGYQFTHTHTNTNTVNDEFVTKIEFNGRLVYNYNDDVNFGVLSGVYYDFMKNSLFLVNAGNETKELVFGKYKFMELKLQREDKKLVEKGYLASPGTVFNKVFDGDNLVWSSEEPGESAVKVLVKMKSDVEMIGIIMQNGTFLLFQNSDNKWDNITQRLLYTQLTH
uniref:SfiI-subtelomeric related protein family member, putative n=1 Tax=Theileria annulata TaxID=5874 RepID=A0A3B0NCL4_THEAN